jgi:hypothetical protein
MALWSGWLSLIEEELSLWGCRPFGTHLPLGPIFEPAFKSKAGFFAVTQGQALRRIRYNRGIAIFRVAVRVKALVALR